MDEERQLHHPRSRRPLRHDDAEEPAPRDDALPCIARTALLLVDPDHSPAFQ